MIYRADFILCANEYRAQIMQKYYKLRALPTVFENFRKLEYSVHFEREKYEKKYEKLFEKDSVKLISTYGCCVERTNDKLVKDICGCKHPVDLYLVGGNTKKDEKIIRNIIDENGMTNVHIIEKVKEDELKFLISKCDIGIVNYGMYDQNNKYCASGKIYEFLFEKIPVVTTMNPPLKKMCDDYDIGVSGENYAEAIDRVIENYDYYASKVHELVERMNVDTYNQGVAERILQAYGESIL